MKTNIFLVVAILMIISCNRNPFIVNFSDISQDEKQVIIDLSKAIEFETRTNELIINDKKYLNDFIGYLTRTNKECKLLIESGHGDRLYLGTQQANINKLKKVLVERGVTESKISAKLSSSFEREYSSKLKKSSIIAILI